MRFITLNGKKFIKRFFIFTLCFTFFSICYLTSKDNIEIIETNSDNFSLEEFHSKIQNIAKENQKIAYLTFDDGPTKSSTPRVLDILKEENIKANFFVIGKYVNHHPDLLKRIHDEGHFIGNHGYNHSNSKLYGSDESFINEITSTDIEISKALGVANYCSHLFRFPYGFNSHVYKKEKLHCVELLKELGYTYVDWNCLNKDSERKYSKYHLLQNLKKSSKGKNNLIILMHDTTDVSDSASALKDSIRFIKEQGYQFKTFNELF